MFKINDVDFDQEEARQYRRGQMVELKASPGVVDAIAEYDPMMVPPIWLVNDPTPRYPEELTLIPRQVVRADRWKPVARRLVSVSAPSCVLAK
jgi:hypothetical protein